MSAARPQTSAANAALWGARARDWAEVQEGIVRAAYDVVLDRAGVGPGTRLLDVGCGSGMAAMLAAERGAAVSGIDAAPALLAIARERVAQGDFREGDLEALPFAAGAFDLVTGFNAFQFAGNPDVALREAARVLAPGGRIAMTVWGEPDGMEMAAIIRALGPLLPPPPPGAGGPFALSDRAALLSLAEASGLRVIDVVDVPTSVVYAALATALRGLDSSGVAERARQIVGAAAVMEAHAVALAPFVQPDGSVCIGAAFRCLFATPA